VFKEEFLIILIFFIIAIGLVLVIAVLSYTLTSQKPELEKLSSYECGFEPYENTRHKFDVKFCLVAILFMCAIVFFFSLISLGLC
jgi:NADH-quinone oxidoreductase subunit A